VCVCLSACEDIYGTTRAIFTNFSMRVAYGRGSVLLLQGNEIPREGTALGVSSPLAMHCNAFASNGIGWEGGDGSAQRGRSVIYYCLEYLPCEP